MIKNWYNKPPQIIQNLGDALQGTALFILGYVTLTESYGLKWLAVTAVVIGALGIFVQKLFKE